MTSPEPQTARELAREQILNHAQNLAQDDERVFEAVLEKDVCATLSSSEREALADDVLTEIGTATVTVSWPDEHGDAAVPRLFRLLRDIDHTGVSGPGHVADGVMWPDGTVTLRWGGAHASTVCWDTLGDARAVHGHGGATRFVFDDEPDGQPQDGDVRAAALLATVSGVCTCSKCEAVGRSIYRMVGKCSNCQVGPILMLFRAGDQARALECPFCGCREVYASRRATDDEIPAAAEDAALDARREGR